MNPILTLTSVSKSINGIPILKDVDFTLMPGEFHLLVGENGAGKSTLTRILCGLMKKDKGEICLDGSFVQINSPKEAMDKGIVYMQEDTFLFESMTVAENIYAGNTFMCVDKFGIIRRKKMNSMAQELINRLDFKLKSTSKVKKLNFAQKRMVEIARLSLLQPKILILEEPLSGLGAFEANVMLNMLANYKKQGTAILYISQRIKEIEGLADRITVMRDGKVIVTQNAGKLNGNNVDKIVWGQYYPEKYPKLDTIKGREIFCVENLSAGRLLRDINFKVFQGEILGITGLVGSGRSNLAKTIFGLRPIRSGTFYIDRLKANIQCPKDAISFGLAYVTDDRNSEGLFHSLSVLQNAFVIKNNKGFMLPSVKYSVKIYKKYRKLINLKTQTPSKSMFALSSGEQQKILLMRWFLSDARIFIFDEPTRGVDIPSKVDIYNLMSDLVRKNGAIILISSNIDELVGMCDRILVLTDGSISYEANRKTPGEFSDIYRHIV